MRLILLLIAVMATTLHTKEIKIAMAAKVKAFYDLILSKKVQEILQAYGYRTL